MKAIGYRRQATGYRLQAAGNRIIKVVILAMLMMLFGHSAAMADVVLVPDFRVDQDPTPNVVYDVASSPAHGYFVVSYRYTGNNYTLMARRFDFDGNPLGDAFLINSTPNTATTGGYGAGVTIDSNGNMIFTWTDTRTGSAHVYYRRFDLNETPLSADTIVDQASYAVGYNIASIPGGGFVIGYGERTGLNWDSYGRIYNSSGNPIGNGFRVDQNPDIDDLFGRSAVPAVSVSQAGRIYFAWVDERDFGNFPDQGSIYARIFDNLGNPLGNDFRADAGWDSVGQPSVATAYTTLSAAGETRA